MAKPGREAKAKMIMPPPWPPDTQALRDLGYKLIRQGLELLEQSEDIYIYAKAGGPPPPPPDSSIMAGAEEETK